MLVLPKKILKRLNRTYTERAYSLNLPTNPVVEDIFLVSYPKSGNTWLRFLLANTLKLHYKIEREVNFFTVQDIIPGLKGSRSLRPEGPFGRTDLPRIIKSHAPYNLHYHRSILLVRDPRDVIVSYYWYQKNYQRIPEALTLSEFVRDPKFGIKAWLTHTESWLFSIKEGQIVQVFLYEDFLSDPSAQMSRLMDLLGIRVENEVIEKAIELSSVENMRASEMKHASTYLVKTQKVSFVRQAKAAKGEGLSESDRQYIEEVTRDVAQLLGYNY